MIRDQVRAQVMERAERQAYQLRRSMKCGHPHWPHRHADHPDGCKNDGTTCICECHDS